MSIASLKVVPEDMKTSIIRIHSYRDKNPEGTFYNMYYGEEIAFGNLTRLLLLMEDMMDKMDSPQASVGAGGLEKGPKKWSGRVSHKSCCQSQIRKQSPLSK